MGAGRPGSASPSTNDDGTIPTAIVLLVDHWGVGTHHLARTMLAFLGMMSSITASSFGYCSRTLDRMARCTLDLTWPELDTSSSLNLCGREGGCG